MFGWLRKLWPRKHRALRLSVAAVLLVAVGAFAVFATSEARRPVAAAATPSRPVPRHTLPSVEPSFKITPAPPPLPDAPTDPIQTTEMLPFPVPANLPALTAAQIDADEHCGLTGGGVLLTFDDWGVPSHIEAISDTLTKYKVGAIFFAIQSDEKYSPYVLTYLHQHGMYVGNHSVTHPLDPSLLQMSDAQVFHEIRDGIPSTYFRPPGNYYDARVQYIAEKLGYKLCSYTVDTSDYQGLPASTLVSEVLRDTRPNGVVLMHMLADSNALEALPAIITGLRAKGFHLCAPVKGTTGTAIPEHLHC